MKPTRYCPSYHCSSTTLILLIVCFREGFNLSAQLDGVVLRQIKRSKRKSSTRCRNENDREIEQRFRLEVI